MEHEGDGDINCSWCTWNGPQELGKETRRIGDQKRNLNHPSYSIAKIGQNIKKSPGDLRRLAVTQTPVKDNKLKLL